MADTIIVTDQTAIAAIIVTDVGDNVATVIVQDVAIEAALLNLARSIEPGAQRNRARYRQFAAARGWQAGVDTGWAIPTDGTTSMTLVEERVPFHTFNNGEIMHVQIEGSYATAVGGGRKMSLAFYKRPDTTGVEAVWFAGGVQGLGGMQVGVGGNPAFYMPFADPGSQRFIYDIKLFGRETDEVLVDGTLTFQDLDDVTAFEYARHVYTINGRLPLDSTDGNTIRLAMAGGGGGDVIIVKAVNIAILGYGNY